MSKPLVWSDDYAFLESGEFEFYYGYQCIKQVGENGDEEWAFEAKKNCVVIEQWYWGELDVGRSVAGECLECLLAGISKFLAKYPPQVPE